MSPPLINSYKKCFAVKRLLQTFLGGPRLVNAPIGYICIQIILFATPAFVLSVINLVPDEYMNQTWKAIIVSCVMMVLDLSLILTLNLLKIAGGGSSCRQVRPDRRHDRRRSIPINISSFSMFEEEDRAKFEGCCKASTWEYVAPNVSFKVENSFAAVFSSITLGLCTPMIIMQEVSPVFRGTGLFTLCIGRYSSVMHVPPEMALFSPVHKNIIFYRPFYLFIIGIISRITCHVYNYDLYYLIIITCLPVLWGLGILPPIHSFFPWLIETSTSIIGGCDSWNYFGSLVSLIACLFGPIICLVLEGHLISQTIAQCLWAYLIVSDLGLLTRMSVVLCEEMPVKSCLKKIWRPCLKITLSVLIICVTCLMLNYVEVDPQSVQREPFIILAMIFSTTCYILPRMLTHFQRKKMFPANGTYVLFAIWASLLTYILHIWITVEVTSYSYDKMVIIAQNETESIDSETYFLSGPNMTLSDSFDNGTTLQNAEITIKISTAHLFSLLKYGLAIRAFAASIINPISSSFDFICADLILNSGMLNNWPILKRMKSFPWVAGLMALLRTRVLRLCRYLRMIVVVLIATARSALIDISMKIKILTVSFLMTPISLIALGMTSLIEGATLIPIFTLPIFLTGFPRPMSFWRGVWKGRGKFKPVSENKTGKEGSSVEWAIYNQLCPPLASEFVAKSVLNSCSLESGNCYIGRCSDRLVFIRVLSSGWHYSYLDVKGLELQEQTSCHHIEAGWMDELIEKNFTTEDRRERAYIWKTNFNQFLSTLKPYLILKIPSYSESRVKINNLTMKNDKAVLKGMFYRAFSYLWVKDNPVFQGMAYRRSIASGRRLYLSNDQDLLEMGAANGHHESNTKLTSIEAEHDNYDVSRLGIYDYPNRGAFRSGGHVFSPHHRRSSMPVDLHFSKGQSYRASLPSTPIDSIAESSTPGFKREHGSLDSGLEVSSQSPNKEMISSLWIKQCVGESLPSNAVKIRAEKIATTAWNAIHDIYNDLVEVDMGLFFKKELLQKLKRHGLSDSKEQIAEMAVKAIRYACKLSLDEIYTCAGDQSTSLSVEEKEQKEVEIFEKLTIYEKDYKFCSPSEISRCIENRDKSIVSVSRTVKNRYRSSMSGATISITSTKNVLHIYKYNPGGENFYMYKLLRPVVEGIWANLGFEMIYLTSDDDERFSIQQDRFLLRNITTQCGECPLGYPVYSSVFRINLFDFQTEYIN